jgi:hypothetical protein
MRDAHVDSPRNAENDARPRLISRIARLTAAIALVLVLGGGASLLLAGGSATSHRWTFVGDAGSPDALGFRVGAPRAGAWSVEDDQAATGARSLVNRVGEEDAPPATLVALHVRARDVHARTRCRVAGDREGDACGVVFRYVDDATHHLARIEPGSRQVVLARVRGGMERVLARTRAPLQAGVWQELAVDARGDVLRVSLNGQGLIDVHDVVPAPIGTVGLWAPSGSEASFDELAIEVFTTAPQVVEVLPFLQRRTS